MSDPQSLLTLWSHGNQASWASVAGAFGRDVAEKDEILFAVRTNRRCVSKPVFHVQMPFHG